MRFIDKIILKSGQEVELYKISGENIGKNILIIGVFHGDEQQGFHAINNYFKNTIIKKPKNNIYIIPCLNPDGMIKNTRKNGNNVDLNRNFPTNNWIKLTEADEYYGGKKAGSEPETQFLIKIIDEIKPNLILSLHSPYAIVNYDGDAINEAKIISSLTCYPVQNDIGYPTPGSFGTYCGIERNISTITLEYDENENIETVFEKSNGIFNWLLKEY